MKNKYIFFIFDLDGVLLNSIENMNFSWNQTRKKFSIAKQFSSYKKYIGIPFTKILTNLGILRNHLAIKEYYKKVSGDQLSKLHLYPKTLYILKSLNKKNIDFSIVTSKDITRTNKILKKFNINPKSIHCPKKNLKGKPHPDQILECLKKNQIKSLKNVCYVGDTDYDFLAAKRAGIDFIFCQYGYGKNLKKYKYKIKKFSELKNFF